MFPSAYVMTTTLTIDNRIAAVSQSMGALKTMWDALTWNFGVSTYSSDQIP